MNRHLQLALLWLLVLALPLQGVAVASMGVCGPQHQAISSPAAGDRVLSDTAAHDHSAHASHRGALTDVGSAPGDGKAAGSACSACAACCIGAALSNDIAADPNLLLVAGPLHPWNVTVKLGFFSDGPYHPPRFILT